MATNSQFNGLVPMPAVTLSIERKIGFGAQWQLILSSMVWCQCQQSKILISFLNVQFTKKELDSQQKKRVGGVDNQSTSVYMHHVSTQVCNTSGTWLTLQCAFMF